MTTRYRALLIGNTSYPDDEANLPGLLGPVNDVPALRAALSDQEYGLFRTEDITVRIEQPSYEVLRTLEDFFSSAVREDLLLVYFSGHGRLDEYGQLFLCARNTITTRLRSTAVGSDQVNEMIEATAAAQIVIVLDCCHGGAFKGDDIVTPVAPTGGRGRYVIAGCRARRLANDAAAPNQLSLFTAYLVDGLIRQPAVGGRMYVTLDDLYDHVYTQVTTSSRQIPQKRATAEGVVPIAKRARAHAALSLSREEVRLYDLYQGETLPPERVRVFGLADGDAWEVVNHPPWIASRNRPTTSI